MKFKRIEVYGFKSFADKYEIPFGSGITGIVGPNGCGKSNVADSIRWVLGEQSAKLLRGNSMQDVIFNGTEKRKSMSYCEVALVFDNTEKLFPSLDYEEVVISRKLYRSGESEYALNRTPCRLKDIVELLRDAGMGREGYSIIGQGRIDELLSSKPEDRRQIFEEAAGISKFKARKVDAERKLGRTRDNLTRIVDILEEKGKQLEPLRRQAESARKWLDLRDKLRHHEINTYIHQYDTASQAKEVISSRIQGITEASEMKQKAYEAAVASYNESMYDLGSIDKNINALREELLTLTVGMEKQAGDFKVLRERLAALFDRNGRLLSENAELDAQYKELLLAVEKSQMLFDKKNVELLSAKNEVEGLRSKYHAAVELLAQDENSAQTNKQALLDAMDRLADIKANMGRLLAERDTLTVVIDDLKKRIAAQAETFNANKIRLGEVNAELEEISDRKQVLSDKLQSLYSKNNDLLATANEVTTKLDKLNEKYYTAESRRKILYEMQKAYDDFAFSIRNLMNDAKTDSDLKNKIEGIVAQIISVDAKYETAVETALGQAMQNVVTRNEEDAKYIIEHLKRKKYGRVTFLPMTAIKPRSIEPRYLSALKMNGCFGVASDIVKYDKKYDNVISGLLGATVIVDNLDTAISLARVTGYAFKIVTLDGEIINTSGAMTGGSKKNDVTNIFSHERELKELTVVAQKLNDEIAELSQQKEQLSIDIDETQNAIKAAQNGIHEADVEIASRSEIRNKLALDVDEGERELAELESECNRDEKRVQKISSDINSVSELEALITSKKQTAKEDDETRQAEHDKLKQRRDEIQEKLTAALLVSTELESEIKSISSDIERMQGEISLRANKLEQNNQEVEQNKAQIDLIENGLKSDEKRDESADAKRIKEVRERLNHLDEYKENLQSKVSVLDKNRLDLLNEVNNLQQDLTKENYLLVKVDTDIEQMEQRIREEYALEYADCLQYKEEGYDVENGMRETAELKRSMHRLGSVNVEAIEMSQVIAAEYEEMDKQKTDLEKAEADLLKIIKELSDEMLSRFSTQFEQIRHNFVKIFKELFNGGNADLELLDSENPLEAGIEIKAQPPEKKLQSISLLSGGEKALTAIAILFAILKLKPMPFCLLDEIEAALDDANANRFAKYLRRFSEDTQFIVITHRKPTMELADSLYGVTMEEKGVSKIVSVKLEDAVVDAK